MPAMSSTPPASAPNPASSPLAQPGGPSAQRFSTSAPVARFVDYFECLQPADLPRLAEFYAPQARFKDPFNDVTGLPAITAIFEHMFVSLYQPRFVVTQVVEQGSQCFLTWEFHFRFQRFAPDQARCILGASHLVWNAAGQVSLHRDYWDAAEELYEKLPVVGALMRWLRRQAAVSR